MVKFTANILTLSNGSRYMLTVPKRYISCHLLDPTEPCEVSLNEPTPHTDLLKFLIRSFMDAELDIPVPPALETEIQTFYTQEMSA